jgi:hypothetical protein
MKYCVKINGISYNTNLTMEMITSNPDKPWDWEWMSCNKNLTVEIIANNPDKPWRVD